MKSILIIIVSGFLLIQDCSSYTPPGNKNYRHPSTKKEKMEAIAQSFKNAKTLYQDGLYDVSYSILYKIKDHKIYSDSVKNFWLENLPLVIEDDPEWVKKVLNDFNIINYELESRIDSILAIKEIEKLQKKQERIEQKQLEQELLETKNKIY